MATEVKAGQVYRDTDKRMKGRYVRVSELFDAFAGAYARCFACTPDGKQINKRTITLSTRTLQTRFELVSAE